MKHLKAINLADFYKTGHYRQYAPGTQYVYSNWTCRSDKWASTLPDFDHKVVFFGLQAVCKYLLNDLWKETFFDKPLEEVLKEYKHRMDSSLGPNAVTLDHITQLHTLGYLPVSIRALPEGSRVNIRVPLFTIVNTLPEFYWITNYLETQISAELWQIITNATIAYEYRRLIDKYAEKTGGSKEFVEWQGHDFSMRGMGSCHDAAKSGAAHLLSFHGTDTIPAIDFVEAYYGSVVAGSVPATEHSVMCMGGQEDEIETFSRLINETYPSGIVSIVSDTWDFWQVITEFTKKLKSDILKRDGKVVFRPDSGDPVDIICGTAQIKDLSSCSSLEDAAAEMGEDIEDVVRNETPHGEAASLEDYGYFKFDNKVYQVTVEFDWNRYDKQYYYIDGTRIGKPVEVNFTPEQKGAVECLWDEFGGTLTSKGYKTLDSHVGLIYGDSITLERASQILERLEAKGFSSDNIVFGIGSYTYQFVTRDTFGQAIKATWGNVNGVATPLSKKPKTDNGVKNSATGLLRVFKRGNDFVLEDNQYTPIGGELRIVYQDGKFTNEEDFATIRERLLG